MQKSDDKYEIRVNDRLFTELMRQERSGQLQREKEEYQKKSKKKKRKKIIIMKMIIIKEL